MPLPLDLRLEGQAEGVEAPVRYATRKKVTATGTLKKDDKKELTVTKIELVK